MSGRMAAAGGLARSLPRTAEAAVERARLRVVPRTRARSTRVPFVSLVTVLLLGGVVGLLFFNTSMQQASFTVSRLQTQETVLAARQEALSMQLQQMQDPQAIARRAQRLGMVIPETPLFLDLATGRVLGDRSQAGLSTRVQLRPPAPRMPAELAPTPEVKVVPPPEGVLPEQRQQRQEERRQQKQQQARQGQQADRGAQGSTQGTGRTTSTRQGSAR